MSECTTTRALLRDGCAPSGIRPAARASGRLRPLTDGLTQSGPLRLRRARPLSHPACSRSRSFFVRDLAPFFRPTSVVPHTLLADSSRSEPYAGGGYSTSDDPALQTFFPLTVRCACSRTIGFNSSSPTDRGRGDRPCTVYPEIAYPQAPRSAHRLAGRADALDRQHAQRVELCAPAVALRCGGSDGGEVDGAARRLLRRRRVMRLAGEPVTFLAGAASFSSTPSERAYCASRCGPGGGGCCDAHRSVSDLPRLITSRSIGSAGARRDRWSLIRQVARDHRAFLFGRYTGSHGSRMAVRFKTRARRCSSDILAAGAAPRRVGREGTRGRLLDRCGARRAPRRVRHLHASVPHRRAARSPARPVPLPLEVRDRDGTGHCRPRGAWLGRARLGVSSRDEGRSSSQGILAALASIASC